MAENKTIEKMDSMGCTYNHYFSCLCRFINLKRRFKFDQNPAKNDRRSKQMVALPIKKHQTKFIRSTERYA